MLIAENVPYYAKPDNAHAAATCTLDIHRPAKEGYATLVFIHGGGLETGDRNEGLNYARRMNDEGFGMVLVNYRLHPRALCPTYLMDGAAAVAWTLEHIAEYGGDPRPRKVFVTGMSAGGYLAPMICLDDRYLAAFGHHTTEIAGCIPISGQMLTHFTIRKERGIPMAQAMIDEYAPLHYAHLPGGPMLCIVGSNDMPARVEENALFAAVRRANGQTDTTLVVVDDRDHNTIMGHWQDADDPAPTAVVKFLRDHLDD